MGQLLKYHFLIVHPLLSPRASPAPPGAELPGETLRCAHAGREVRLVLAVPAAFIPDKQLNFISWFSLCSARGKLLFLSSLKIILGVVIRSGPQENGAAAGAGAQPCDERPRVPAGPAAPLPPAPARLGSFGYSPPSPKRRVPGRSHLTGLLAGGGWGQSPLLCERRISSSPAPGPVGYCLSEELEIK